jgi:hypothetical protein
MLAGSAIMAQTWRQPFPTRSSELANGPGRQLTCTLRIAAE